MVGRKGERMKKPIIHFNTELDRNFKPIEGGLLTGCFCLWFKANPDATKKEIADMISKALVEQAEKESNRLKDGDFILKINGSVVDE